MSAASIEQILHELRELRTLIESPAPRPDDFLTAAYVAQRTGLAERTVLAGKAGTKEIPRVLLKEEGTKRPVVRFARVDVDNWIRRRLAEAHARQPRQRALRLVSRKRGTSIL